jgi:hypothetical protein
MPVHKPTKCITEVPNCCSGLTIGPNGYRPVIRDDVTYLRGIRLPPRAAPFHPATPSSSPSLSLATPSLPHRPSFFWWCSRRASRFSRAPPQAAMVSSSSSWSSAAVEFFALQEQESLDQRLHSPKSGMEEVKRSPMGSRRRRVTPSPLCLGRAATLDS